MLREIDLTTEHTNLKINPCNYLHGLNVPSTVEVYVTLEEEHDLDNAFPLKNNSILRLKKNGVYIAPKQLYIHTVGTSSSTLDIQTDVINYNNNEYVEIEQQDNQTMNLNAELTTAILLLNDLDKIVNPFEPDYEILNSSYGAATAANILNIASCTFDECDIIVSCNNTVTSLSKAVIKIDGENSFQQTLYYGDTNYRGERQNSDFTLKDMLGKSLVIEATGLVKVYAVARVRKV